MNTANLQFLSVLQIQDDTGQTTAAGREYQQVLDSVRSSIASDHADELAAALDSAEAMQTLKSLIYKYAAEQLAGTNADLDELTERIYQDMAGLGILTKHLLDPEVEEINVNGYDMVEIIRPDGTVFLEGRDAFPVAGSGAGRGEADAPHGRRRTAGRTDPSCGQRNGIRHPHWRECKTAVLHSLQRNPPYGG